MVEKYLGPKDLSHLDHLLRKIIRMLDTKKWSTQWGGRELTVEVGHFALQTNASCTVQYGETVVMATVAQSSNVRDIDYFPLMVDFEERLYAAGRIKGSRFIKREGRPSEDAILSGRMIDRAIRPLFDDRTRTDVQVVLTTLAIDNENDAAITAFIAASCALSISSVRWEGPIAGTRIGMDANGEFILNVTTSELEAENGGNLDLVVAGTSEKMIMVESGANEVPEETMIKALKFGSDNLAVPIELIKKVQAEVGLEKDAEPSMEETEVSKATAMAEAFVASQADAAIFNEKKFTRKERTAMVNGLKESAKAHLVSAGIEDEDVLKNALKNVKLFVAKQITKRILDKEQRLDGRSLTEIRELISEVDLLPRVHGSGLFMRGDTQVLSVVTLGSPGDVQILDSMEEVGTKRYMHHYNDAPYTYGEAGFMRGPGRRAIGHGALAERALMPVLPSVEDFPYTMRVVSEVLGSNGSSSMASTCGSTLSLMASGVPLTKHVAGIAMGLASDLEGRYKVLTDLQDVEDGPGGMDFKITGTKDGITAMQMDTKTHGLVWDIIEQTVKQSAVARKEILENMSAVMPEARTEMSPHAPRIVTITIDPEKIRDVIGPGGKVINKIIEDTGVQIDIEQDGRVMITSTDGEGMAKAVKIVEDITKDVEAGEVYDGKVVRLEDFGAFVQILPGKDGLVHVSEISWERTNKPSDALKMGDEVKVKVKEIDNLGRVNLSMKALIPKPEGYVEPPKREDRGPRSGGPRGPRSGGPRHGGPRGGGNRGPRRDNDRGPRAPRPDHKPAPKAPAAEKPAPKKKGFFGFGK
jgi:polyribonucleotide nucleotidyltransferase